MVTTKPRVDLEIFFNLKVFHIYRFRLNFLSLNIDCVSLQKAAEMKTSVIFFLLLSICATFKAGKVPSKQTNIS